MYVVHTFKFAKMKYFQKQLHYGQYCYQSFVLCSIILICFKVNKVLKNTTTSFSLRNDLQIVIKSNILKSFFEDVDRYELK